MQTTAPRLTLQVLRLDGQPVTASLQKVFDERGGTIGRAAQNDWVLPDPSRFLSAHHATVYCEGGRFGLIDCSTNGIYLNDEAEPLGPGRVANLAHGDRLMFGDYEVAVVVAPAAQMPGPADALDPLQLLDAHAPSPRRAAAPAESAAREPWFDAGRPSPARQAAVAIGDSAILDPLALLDASSGIASPGLGAPRRPPSGIAADRDDAPLLTSHFQPPAVNAPVPADWLETGVGSAPVGAASPAPSRPIEPPPQRKAVAALASRPTAAAPADTAGDASLHSALDLLLRAAGLDPARAPRDADPRETLQSLGSLLHESVAALRELMLRRSASRQRLGLAATCIAPRDNNPLKFAARGAAEVIDGFLFGRAGSCLDAKAAIHEAVQDLKAQRDEERLALLQALRGQLDRIDPQRIERECGESRRLRLISGKADCWALYAARFAELRPHLDDPAATAPPTPLPRRGAALQPCKELGHGLA